MDKNVKKRLLKAFLIAMSLSVAGNAFASGQKEDSKPDTKSRVTHDLFVPEDIYEINPKFKNDIILKGTIKNNADKNKKYLSNEFNRAPYYYDIDPSYGDSLYNIENNLASRLLYALYHDANEEVTINILKDLGLYGMPQNMSIKEKVIAVNKAVNNYIEYKLDGVNWGEDEFWAAASETMEKKSGDCEDYAILKYHCLRSIGVPAERIAVCAVDTEKRDSNDIDHAALIVNIAEGNDKQTFVYLENSENPIYANYAESKVRFRFLINENGIFEPKAKSNLDISKLARNTENSLSAINADASVLNPKI